MFVHYIQSQACCHFQGCFPGKCGKGLLADRLSPEAKPKANDFCELIRACSCTVGREQPLATAGRLVGTTVRGAQKKEGSGHQGQEQSHGFIKYLSQKIRQQLLGLWLLAQVLDGVSVRFDSIILHNKQPRHPVAYNKSYLLFSGLWVAEAQLDSARLVFTFLFESAVLLTASHSETQIEEGIIAWVLWFSWWRTNAQRN